MKHFSWALTVLAFVCCMNSATAARGPISQGSWIINGNVGLTANLTAGSTYLYIQPSAMTFIQDHIAVGGEFGLSTGDGATFFTLIPQAAYYLGDTHSKGFPFLGAGLGIITGGGSTNLAVRLGGGYASMLSNDVCLNITGMFLINSGNGTSTSFNLNCGVGVFLF